MKAKTKKERLDNLTKFIDNLEQIQTNTNQKRKDIKKFLEDLQEKITEKKTNDIEELKTACYAGCENTMKEFKEGNPIKLENTCREIIINYTETCYREYPKKISSKFEWIGKGHKYQSSRICEKVTPQHDLEEGKSNDEHWNEIEQTLTRYDCTDYAQLMAKFQCRDNLIECEKDDENSFLLAGGKIRGMIYDWKFKCETKCKNKNRNKKDNCTSYMKKNTEEKCIMKIDETRVKLLN